ncbi:MAG TPA: TolC family protein [Cytophagaceae bacterium]|nr:TolC family protein [Cytophagaceae bacterium]
MLNINDYRKIKSHSAFLILLGFYFNGIAQTNAQVPIVKLDSIVAAIEKNPRIQVYNERINSLNAYAKGARSWESPQISGGFWMTPYNRKDNPNMGMLMISGQQMIPNPGKLRAKENYMQGMSSTEGYMQNADRQDMIREAKSLYFDWAILKRKQKVLKESEDLLNLLIKTAEIEYTYNQQNLARIYKAKSELYQLNNNQSLIEQEIKQKNTELNILMNISRNFVFDVDTSYSFIPYETSQIDSVTILNSRSDIKQLNESIRIASLKQSLELSRRKPDFGIRYDHMYGFGNSANLFTVMGMVTIPIAPWAAKEYKANLAGLNFEKIMIKKQQEVIYNEVYGRLNSIKINLANKKRQLDLYDKSIIPALQKNYKSTLLSYQHREEDMFMVLDAWQALIMARTEYFDKVNEVLQLQIEYEREIEK